MRWPWLSLAMVLSLPAIAQEDRGGMRSFVSVGAGLIYDDNPDLTDVASGGGSAVLTELQFGLSSETRRQTFLATGDINARDRTIDAGRIALSYGLSAAQSSLTGDLEIWRRSSGTFAGAFDTGLDAGSAEVVPDGETLTAYLTAMKFVAGKERSIGYELGVLRSERRYQGETGSIRDVDEHALHGALTFRFSKMTEARLELEKQAYESTGPAPQTIDTDEIRLGLSHQFNPRTRVSFTLGQRRLDTIRSGAKTASTGLELSFDVKHASAMGEVFAMARVDQQTSGRRDTLRFGLQREAAQASLSVWAGVTRRHGEGADLIGGVRYYHKGDDRAFSAAIERLVGATPESDDMRITDRIGLDWRQRLSLRGNLDLEADYLRTAASFAQTERHGLRVQAAYSHDIGGDWALKTGLRLRARQEGDNPRTRSRTVFLTFEKRLEAIH